MDIVNKVDSAGLLKEGNSQIRFMVNGQQVELRFYVANGGAKSIDTIPGWSGRDIQNVVYIKGNIW